MYMYSAIAQYKLDIWVHILELMSSFTILLRGIVGVNLFLDLQYSPRDPWPTV